MSSTISISENPSLGYAINTSMFETIIDAIRPYFTEEQQGCMKQIYGDHDDCYQQYIYLCEVSAECFNLFVQYCEKAKQEFSETEEAKRILKNLETAPPGYEYWMDALYNGWEDLLVELKKDPRYKQE
jgi:hypothetical protein